MSIPNQALQKVRNVILKLAVTPLMSTQLAQEIESQALSAQRQINIVKSAITAKQRDIRMLELTSTEVKQLSKDTKVYQGVGKM